MRTPLVIFLSFILVTSSFSVYGQTSPSERGIQLRANVGISPSIEKWTRFEFPDEIPLFISLEIGHKFSESITLSFLEKAIVYPHLYDHYFRNQLGIQAQFFKGNSKLLVRSTWLNQKFAKNYSYHHYQFPNMITGGLGYRYDFGDTRASIHLVIDYFGHLSHHEFIIEVGYSFRIKK